MSGLQEGKAAPEFTLADQDGKARKLAEFRGKPLVLFFYSKAMTPG